MIRLALVFSLLTWPALAQDNAATAAREAATQLEAATRQMDTAEDASDRVAALTEAIRAYEAGLGAMRDGLRNAAIRETELTRLLQSQEQDISELLGVLQSLGDRTGPAAALHPDGPLNTVRAGMLVVAVTPGLVAKADVLRGTLDEVTLLRRLQEDAADRLREGLSGVQLARTRLSQAMAERTDLPKRFTEDPTRTALLIAATETLEGFASGLSEIAGGDILPTDASIDAQRGSLPLPVPGEIIRRFNEADAAEVVRPGLVVATRPRALVTSPTSATVRYLGPLLDYGLVAILEPQPDLLLVMAGMDQVFGEIGAVLPAGSPVGLMGGSDAQQGDILSQSGERGGNTRPETLYIEVREGDAPVDPLNWFTTDKG